MEIVWRSGNKDMKGFWRMKMYVGEEYEGVGEIKYKGF